MEAVRILEGLKAPLLSFETTGDTQVKVKQGRRKIEPKSNHCAASKYNFLGEVLLDYILWRFI